MFDLFCPVSQRRRISMEACHLKSLPRQNTNTPCHQSEFLQISANISDVIFFFFFKCNCSLLFSISRKDIVRLMMNKIFQSIETELNSLIALGDKIDSFHSLYMLVKMSHHVWTAENVDPASYLSTTLGNVLVTVKRNFDKCIVSSAFFVVVVDITKFKSG